MIKSLLILFISQIALCSIQINEILELKIDSSINPATLDYLNNSLKDCQPNQLALIKMNTPGGLVSTTKKIISLIGEEKCPVAIWITPQGSSATSAGAIISSAAHYLFMSSGSNIGASTPINSQGKNIDNDARKKAINDLSALVRSLSKARKRNPKAYEEMISQASSFDSKQALKMNIIDDVANDQNDIFNFINTNSINFKGKKQSFKINKSTVKLNTIKPTLGQKLLNILANPSFAYLIFLIGVALLYFEFQTPGGFIAGALGCIFLVIAAISFQIIPINMGALGLIILAFILFILEIYITSYGILSIGALASLVTGSLFLYRHEGSFIALDYKVVASIALGVIVCLVSISYLLIKDMRKKPTHFFDDALESASIIKFIEKNNQKFIYQVKSQGEIWSAISNKELEIGSQVKIQKQENQLSVKIINN